ncbi:MAG: hypothetical protein GC180_06895 [Bacteroidetes bacterium]|nr:hypothetical protein [Bacteroidota bacterium]
MNIFLFTSDFNHIVAIHIDFRSIENFSADKKMQGSELHSERNGKEFVGNKNEVIPVIFPSNHLQIPSLNFTSSRLLYV